MSGFSAGRVAEWIRSIRGGAATAGASSPQLSSIEQQLRASNQQLHAHEQQLRAINKELMLREEQFRSVVEHLPMGMHRYRLDEQNRLLFVGANAAADRILGVPNQQFVGKEIAEAFPSLAHTEVPAWYRDAAARGTSWQTEQIDYCDDKIHGTFEVFAFQTGPGQMAAVFHDITGRKRTELELRAANEQLSAHEQQLRASNQQLRASEQALRSSEDRYRMMFESIHTAVVVYEAVDGGRDFVIRSFNTAAESTERVRREDVIGRRVSEVFPGVRDFGIVDVFSRVWRTGSAERFPLGMYKDERIAGWRDNYIYKLASGEIVAVYSDETDRRKAEQARDQLFDCSIDMLCVAGFDGMFKQINPAWSRTLGWSSQELLARPWIEFVHPDDRESTRSVNEQLVDGRTVYSFENRYQCKDGSYRWISWNSFPLPKEGIMFGVARDVTARRITEETLRESEASYRALSANLPGILYRVLLRENGRMVFYNDMLRELTGYRASELGQTGARSLDALIVPEDTARVVVALAAAVERDEPFHVEYRVRAKDGTVRHFSERGRPQRGQDGEPLFIDGMIFDVTDRRRVEEEFQKRERLESLGILAGGIAHDFNNLLGGLFGYIDMARVYGILDAQTREYLDKSIGCFQRARDLTQQLLTFAKGGTPMRSVVAIGSVVKDAAALALSGSNVRCEYALDADIRAVDADASQISQAINNIVLNARHAMPDGGTVTVSIRNEDLDSGNVHGLAAGPYVRISVADRGAGIAPEHCARVFDPFFTTKQHGSGLGLATSYSIVKKHDGHIWVESVLGEGATFHILLPASAAPVVESGTPDDAIAVSSSLRVLVMDDEPVVLDMVAQMLTGLGHTVSIAADGDAAVRLYQNLRNRGTQFDAVILDLTVPGGMGGKRTVEELLRVNPDVKAIVASGYSDDPVMSEFRNYGFVAAVKKPFRIKDLADVLRRAVGGA